MKDEDILTTYLREINCVPLLTREEEVALAQEAQAGSKRAKDKIARANLRFVVNVAKKYQNHGVELSDLISEGNVGLLHAIERFDVSKGYHFISYAVWWIRQSILKAICEKSRAIRLPLNRANEIVQIEQARKIILGASSEEEEFAEVAELLHMTAAHVRELINISREMVSLDAPVGNDAFETATLGEFIQDTRNAPEELAMTAALKEDIDTVLKTLRPNEEKVLRMRYGLNNTKPMSLKEVGVQCNLTKERIRQIEKHAIKRLQHPRRGERLAAFVA